MRTLVLLLLVAVSASGDSLDDALLKAGMKRQDLGWTPKYDLAEGLREYLAWRRSAPFLD